MAFAQREKTCLVMACFDWQALQTRCGAGGLAGFTRRPSPGARREYRRDKLSGTLWGLGAAEPFGRRDQLHPAPEASC